MVFHVSETVKVGKNSGFRGAPVPNDKGQENRPFLGHPCRKRQRWGKSGGAWTFRATVVLASLRCKHCMLCAFMDSSSCSIQATPKHDPRVCHKCFGYVPNIQMDKRTRGWQCDFRTPEMISYRTVLLPSLCEHSGHIFCSRGWECDFQAPEMLSYRTVLLRSLYASLDKTFAQDLEVRFSDS